MTTGHASHELDDKGRCLNHPAVRSRHEREHPPTERTTPVTFSADAETPTVELSEGTAFDVARSLRFHAKVLRDEADSLASTASYLEHRYLNGVRSDA